jgi:S1-C subfamily serine protease
MNKFVFVAFAIVSMLGQFTFSFAQRAPAPGNDLNTILMHATFEILGPKYGAPDKTSFGTVFVIGKPDGNNPAVSHIVIVTAAHVLDEIEGDTATLIVRRPAPDGIYVSYPYTLLIRENGAPLYIKHNSADVAAMYANLPDDVPVSGVTPAFLVDDKRLTELEVHPGDEVFVLGFPLSAQAPGGFPILRSAHIASYPLVPQKVVKQFELDVGLFGGNSGGPVYFSYVNRIYNNAMHLGEYQQGLLGLIIERENSTLPEYAGTSLNYGVVLPAQFIREVIDSLPPSPVSKPPTATPAKSSAPPPYACRR